MSLSPWLPWPSAPPGPSSVPHWLLHHFIVIAILYATTVGSSSVSSNQTDTLCANPSEFPHLMHTIGSIDSTLWAISIDKWNVYELEPCKGNDSIGHCMQVNPHSDARLPVSVDKKWPKLVEALKNATHKTDFSFSMNSSLVMDSSPIWHISGTVLICMYLNDNKYDSFGFEFGTNHSFPTDVDKDIRNELGVWISSDVKDKAYRLSESGRVFESLKLTQAGQNIYMVKENLLFICNSTKKDGLEVIFSKANCPLNVSWTVVKGLHAHNQFYLFALDKVYIFSDLGLNVSTKVQTVSYEDFLQCTDPTTLAPPRHSTSNSTKSSNFTSTTHGHKVTTAKESNKTILIVVVGVVVIVVLILVAVAVWYFYFHKKADKKVQNVEGVMLGAPSPASALHSDISSIPLLNIDELKKASYERSDSRLGYALETKLFTQKGPNSQAKAKECKRKRPASDSGSIATAWSKDGSIPAEVPPSKMAPITKKKGGAGKTQQSSQSKQTVHSKQSKSAVVKGKGSSKNPPPNKKAKGGLTMESEYPTPKTNPSSRTRVPKVYSKSKN